MCLQGVPVCCADTFLLQDDESPAPALAGWRCLCEDDTIKAQLAVLWQSCVREKNIFEEEITSRSREQ